MAEYRYRRKSVVRGRSVDIPSEAIGVTIENGFVKYLEPKDTNTVE